MEQSTSNAPRNTETCLPDMQDQIPRGMMEMTTKDCVNMLTDSLEMILRHSTEDEFRKECFDMLHVTNSNDAEVILRNKMLTMFGLEPEPVPETLETAWFLTNNFQTSVVPSNRPIDTNTVDTSNPSLFCEFPGSLLNMTITSDSHESSNFQNDSQISSTNSAHSESLLVDICSQHEELMFPSTAHECSPPIQSQEMVQETDVYYPSTSCPSSPQKQSQPVSVAATLNDICNDVSVEQFQPLDFSSQKQCHMDVPTLSNSLSQCLINHHEEPLDFSSWGQSQNRSQNSQTSVYDSGYRLPAVKLGRKQLEQSLLTSVAALRTLNSQ